MGNTSSQEPQKKTRGCLLAFVITIIVFAAIAGIIYGAYKYFFNETIHDNTSNNGIINNDGTGKLLSRSANNGDIDIDFDDDFSLRINITVTPNTDIKNLQITFSFIDKNNSTITTKTKVLGNVVENHPYSVTFSLSEFSFSQIMKIEYISATVSGGTVSYFA